MFTAGHIGVPSDYLDVSIRVEDEKLHSSVSACSRQTCGSGL
jgi:hypothetical protein